MIVSNISKTKLNKLLMKKHKPLAKFRIYVWRSSYLFFHVYIWKYKYQMHNAWNRDDQSIGNCAAFTHPYTIIRIPSKEQDPKQRQRMLPICGEIHFHIKDLGSEAISHESTHATMTVLRRLKFNFDKVANDQNEDYMNSEEIIAYCVGHFTKQIVNKIYSLKILAIPILNSKIKTKN